MEVPKVFSFKYVSNWEVILLFLTFKNWRKNRSLLEGKYLNPNTFFLYLITKNLYVLIIPFLTSLIYVNINNLN